MTQFEVRSRVLKVDQTLGLVFGWGIVCTQGGEPYFDVQGDHIPEEAMLKAAADFMEVYGDAGEMHVRKRAGTVVFAFPLTQETADAFGIETDRTGLMIAMRPDEEMMAKFRSGELTGFSIGGFRGEDKVVE